MLATMYGNGLSSSLCTWCDFFLNVVIGFKSLITNSSEPLLSSEYLLSHSVRFLQVMESTVLTSLGENRLARSSTAPFLQAWRFL